jgi:hypothetical protein
MERHFTTARGGVGLRLLSENTLQPEKTEISGAKGHGSQERRWPRLASMRAAPSLARFCTTHVGVALSWTPIRRTAILLVKLTGCSKQEKTLQDWLDQPRRTGLPEIGRFCDGLQRNAVAVKPPFTMSWSNGQVEGHHNPYPPTRSR